MQKPRKRGVVANGKASKARAGNRADHQPLLEPEARPQPSEEELERACGRTAALVLATDLGATPLRVTFEDADREPVVCGEGAPLPRPLQRYEGVPAVGHAVETAQRSRLAGVTVLAGGDADLRKRIGEAAAQAARRVGAEPPAVVALDRQRCREATRAAAGFELFGFTKGVLDYARVCLDELPDADSVLLMACDQVRITPSHVLDVCRTFREQPNLDVVTSWIVWLRRTPLLLSRALLDGLDESPLVKARAEGADRPLPALAVEEVVFGEEQLAANAAVPQAVEAFFDECTLSAREAVQLARGERTATEAEANGEEGRSAADEHLLGIARQTLAQLEGALGAGDATALERADAWGRRNRGDFPLLVDADHRDTLAYLDSAATTQRAFRCLEAQHAFDAHGNANVYRGSYELSARATATLNDARKTLEDFIGADRRQTVYTANATASCNLVAQAWGERNVGEGDLIVATIAEHHSNLLPWLMLAERTGARLEYVPVQGDGRLDQDAYRALLAQKPKLVCVAHVGNVLGMANPVERMAAQAHETGARFLVDAAQSLPHLPLDVKALGADFVAFSAHKMYGPLGIGGLWIAPEAFAEMDPVASGGGAISHVSDTSYYLRQGAIQYELGTPPISQAIGWAGAIDYLRGLGMDAVAAHSAALTRYLVAGLHGIEGVTVWGDHDAPDGALGLVAFTLAGVAPAEVGAACGRLGVAIRSGGHCALPLAARMGVVGTARASFGVHTTREDVEALLVAVEACRQLYEERL